MLADLYFTIQTLAIIFFILAWFRKTPMMWALAIVLTGIQMVTSFNIQFLVVIVDRGVVSNQLINYSNTAMFGVNFLFFSVALLMFIVDLFFNKDMKQFQNEDVSTSNIIQSMKNDKYL